MKLDLKVLVAVACSVCVPSIAQNRASRTKPADAQELAAITSRGQAIAAYDAAAWHATDAVLKKHPPIGAVTMYIGRKSNKGWEVAFGKLNDSQDAFLMTYEAEPTNDVLHPKVTETLLPRVEREDWLNIARAYDLARLQINVTREYNGAVLAAPDGTWYVYLYPAQTSKHSFLMGADTRFLINHDGTKILETRPLHVSLLNNELPEGEETPMTFHTAVLDDTPEDTDVASVLMMGGIPMMIASKSFVYRIEADGKIAYLGPTETVFNDAKK